MKATAPTTIPAMAPPPSFDDEELSDEELSSPSAGTDSPGASWMAEFNAYLFCSSQVMVPFCLLSALQIACGCRDIIPG